MASATSEVGAFPSPFSIETPPGCEGWEEMYPYWSLFDEHRRRRTRTASGSGTRMHFPLPMPAFDIVEIDHPYYALGGWQNRAFAVPPVMGVDYRIVNGYVYISPNPVTDPEKIGRARGDTSRSGRATTSPTGTSSTSSGASKMEALNREVEAIAVPEPARVRARRGRRSATASSQQHRAAATPTRHTLHCAELMWQHHFEFLLLGYGAYLTFAEFCASAAGHPRPAHLADGRRHRRGAVPPDEELRRLARLAIETDVDGRVRRRDARPTRSTPSWARATTGRSLARRAREDQGPLVQHGHRRRALPLLRQLERRPEHPVRLADRAHRGARGRRGHRAADRGARQGERDRLAAEYGALLDEEARPTFEELLGLSRTVFPYVEEHKFYCDYWFQSRFFNKIREFGALLAEHGFLEDGEDIFQLSRHEAMEALEELGAHVGDRRAGARPAPLAADRRRAARSCWRSSANGRRRPRSARCPRRSTTRWS